ncbi:Hypothetical_protein [Hexamita inflata]|uniref:Hypothetical_protein n=1 Tax=Hexamita inflata TaxID=28002 RepID=A0AA86Q096_9EUKA|nr:Hypothetical protein HINF_LOCUS25744 [Hexamita inflata]CAI9948728.1 Hypothetical protein HINF_LOCUS36373 [Hexamita inflata]
MPPPSFLNQWNIQSTQAFSENNRFFMTIQRYEAVRTLQQQQLLLQHQFLFVVVSWYKGLMLQAGKDPSFPLLLNRMQFQSIICSNKNPDRVREVSLKYFLKTFLSQEDKIMLEDSNFEERSKI